MRSLLVTLCLMLLVAGCANRPPMTRAEYLALTTREYSDITVDELYAAAEAMFEFSSPGGYQYAHSDAGMQAVETGLTASGSWTLSVTKVDRGVRLQVSFSGQGGAAFLPVVTTGGGMGFAAGPGGMVAPVGTASYDLFWARLDYMLGRRAAWMTCADARERLLSGAVWGGPATLCGRRLMDPVPERPVIARR